jgi:hypothetical protein
MVTLSSRVVDTLPAVRRIGLDAEALPMVSWNDRPYHRHVISFAWGAGDDVNYIETLDRRPGRFNLDDLERLRADVTAPDVVVVGHNAFKYDLPTLNGVLIGHGFDPLPAIRCQDTMNDLKTGGTYKNSLSAQCRRYGVQLKQGGPDWDGVMCGDASEWATMRAYNVNDVVCTLELERALAGAGLPCPVKTWRPRRGKA